MLVGGTKPRVDLLENSLQSNDNPFSNMEDMTLVVNHYAETPSVSSLLFLGEQVCRIIQYLAYPRCHERII